MTAEQALLKDILGRASDLPVITEILPAILGALDPDLPGAQTTRHQEWGLDNVSQQLVIMVDGLGLNLLESRMGHAPTLRAHRRDMSIARTVIPSTTAAAITAFGTGEHPGKTHMVGYSVALADSVMNLLAFNEDTDPEQWQSVATLFERVQQAGVESVVISPPTFASSGLTRAALRGARHVGAVSLTDRVNAALRELRRGTPLVYLYWSEIDHVGHKFGAHSSLWTAALEEFDAGVKNLLRHLPRGVQTVLTADHGMVDVKQADLLDLAHDPELRAGVRIIAGETRSVHVHAEDGQGQMVRKRWRERLGDRAYVLDPQEITAVMSEPASQIIGDALVLMKRRFGVVDSRIQAPGAIALVGVHGSITDDEMLIPVMRLS